MKRILIASVLKPVDDIRHYHKITLSIRKTNKYEIHIIGNASKIDTLDRDIIFYPRNIKKSFLSRLAVQGYLIRKIVSLRPDKIIITTIELIPVTVILKLFFSFDLIFDKQENYIANYKNQVHNPWIRREINLLLIRAIRRMVYPFINEFWLAEKSYLNSIKKYKNRSIILENKSVEIENRSPSTYQEHEEFTLLFSGTLSKYSGVQQSINILNSFQENGIQTKLVIIGVCWDSSLIKWLKNQASQNSKIELFIDSKPISHNAIVDKIRSAHLGLILYDPTNDSGKRMPTKCFEYAAAQLPYLVPRQTYWEDRGKKIGGMIPVNMDELDIKSIFNQANQLNNQWIPGVESPLWFEEEPKLFDSKILQS